MFPFFQKKKQKQKNKKKSKTFLSKTTIFFSNLSNTPTFSIKAPPIIFTVIFIIFGPIKLNSQYYKLRPLFMYTVLKTPPIIRIHSKLRPLQITKISSAYYRSQENKLRLYNMYKSVYKKGKPTRNKTRPPINKSNDSFLSLKLFPPTNTPTRQLIFISKKKAKHNRICFQYSYFINPVVDCV